MGFFSGRITFDAYRTSGAAPAQFGPEHIKLLKRYAIGQREASGTEGPAVGFLAGEHLFDQEFTLEKNALLDTLHCGIRIDSDQIPSAVRKAWLQMELATVAAENESGRPTKAQRQEAKDAVAARCEEEARSGRFRRMQQFPVLWDAPNHVLYFGGSSPTASEHCANLYAEAFELELERLSAGRRAQEWAIKTKQRKALEDVMPSAFEAGQSLVDIDWWNHESGNLDFLGNEFLLWLWWLWETHSDTVELSDGTEVTGMIARTLALQCPRGESGKETISAEMPARLPEAAQAICSGKLPRKAGLVLVRQGQQYELVLQAETFSISGAKIQTDDTDEAGSPIEDRLEGFRDLNITVDLLYQAFCQRRIGKAWAAELEQMRKWLKKGAPRGKGS